MSWSLIVIGVVTGLVVGIAVAVAGESIRRLRARATPKPEAVDRRVWPMTDEEIAQFVATVNGEPPRA